MKARLKINQTLFASIVALVALILFLVLRNQAPNDFPCPDKYETAEAYRSVLSQWISREMDNNPEMTGKELTERGVEYYKQNCGEYPWFGEMPDVTRNTPHIDGPIAVSAHQKQIHEKKTMQLYAYSRE